MHSIESGRPRKGFAGERSFRAASDCAPGGLRKVRVERLRIAGPHELNRLTGCRLGIGSSSLIAAVVASTFTFASISAEAPAGSFDAASLGGRLIQSVVGTIYSESGESSAPTGSHTAGVRLAS